MKAPRCSWRAEGMVSVSPEFEALTFYIVQHSGREKASNAAWPDCANEVLAAGDGGFRCAPRQPGAQPRLADGMPAQGQIDDRRREEREELREGKPAHD